MLFGVYNVFCQQALSGIPMLSFGLWRWMLSLPIIYLRVRGQPPADRVQPTEAPRTSRPMMVRTLGPSVAESGVRCPHVDVLCTAVCRTLLQAKQAHF